MKDKNIINTKLNVRYFRAKSSNYSIVSYFDETKNKIMIEVLDITKNEVIKLYNSSKKYFLNNFINICNKYDAKIKIYTLDDVKIRIEF